MVQKVGMCSLAYTNSWKTENSEQKDPKNWKTSENEKGNTVNSHLSEWWLSEVCFIRTNFLEKY